MYQDLFTKAVWLALNVQDNWIFHLIMMAEMVGFTAKIVMETSMDTKESQGKKSVRYVSVTRSK